MNFYYFSLYLLMFIYFFESTQVIWHQALLAFAQRYKFEFDDSQRERLKQLVRIQQHHQITIEVKRELIAALSGIGNKSNANDEMSMGNR